MNKKVIVTTQNSNEQKLKTKTLIINLGTATQVTLGNGGSRVEKGPRAYQPWVGD